MKLQVLQENLAKAVSIASRFATSKAQLPILGNILFSAQKTKLLISSTNLELSTCIQIGAKINEDGAISIPARVISELVNHLPKETISLESEKEQLKVTATGFSANILGMNPLDFPSIPTSIKKDQSIVFSKKVFTESLSKVLFATSIDETRPILTGVLFVLDKNGLSLVATDGFRLSQKKMKLGQVKQSLKINLPKTILSEISRISEIQDEILFNLQEKEKQVVFGVDDVILTSRVLEGEFPDFEKIIPKTSTYKILTDKEEFLRAVKLASVFARDSANIVKMQIFGDAIKISAESASSGTQETKVDAKIEGPISSDGFEIAFNFRFLEDFLQAVTGDEVKMEFSNETSPGVFTDSSDPLFLHLIMPVRISS